MKTRIITGLIILLMSISILTGCSVGTSAEKTDSSINTNILSTISKSNNSIDLKQITTEINSNKNDKTVLNKVSTDTQNKETTSKNPSNNSSSSIPAGNKITLKKLSLPEPKPEDFGEYYNEVMLIYNGIINGEKDVHINFESGKNGDYFLTHIMKEVFNEKVAFGMFSTGGHVQRGSSWIFRFNDLVGIEDKFQKVYNACVSAGLKNGMSEREAVKKINTWICDNIYYKDYLDAFTALDKGYGVCSTYAELFKIMCNTAGIECEEISGYVKAGPHAWNQVKIGGKWYYVDVCWNDTPSNRTKYLLTEKLWSDHWL